MMVLSIALKLLRFKKKKEKRKTFIDFDSLSALFSKVIEREFHVGTGFDFCDLHSGFRFGTPQVLESLFGEIKLMETMFVPKTILTHSSLGPQHKAYPSNKDRSGQQPHR